MKNVDALKTLYIALGGSADTVKNIDTIAEMISAIAVVAGTIATKANTSDLPAVTATNNGQVLTVDGGEWKAKDLPE